MNCRHQRKPRKAWAKSRKLALSPIFLLSLFCISCTTVGPDYEPPQFALKADYTAELERGLGKGSAELSEWWKKLSDPDLDRLVDQALAQNLDIKRALARIRESRAMRGVVTPDLMPTIDVSGSFSQARLSEQTPNGAFIPGAINNFAIGFDASWELDVWGRIRRSIESADAAVSASVEDARDVLVSVLAECALNYVELRNFQARAAIARANILSQEQTLKLTQNRFDAGLVSELDVAQAAAILESTRSTLPSLHTAARAARNRLAVLLGRVPGELEETLGEEKPIPTPPVEFAVGVPADTLRRRPDIRRQERLLAAQHARIGMATADLYPRLTLVGQLNVQAQDLGDLFSGNPLAYNFSPSFSWNIFDRDRIHSRIEVEDARTEQAFLDYERAVLVGLEEVENAMTGFVRDQISRDHVNRAVDHSRRALELSRDQYRQGLVGFQSVLDSQRRLFELEDALVSRNASIVSNLIILYKALGGGWESRPIFLAQPQANEETP